MTNTRSSRRLGFARTLTAAALTVAVVGLSGFTGTAPPASAAACLSPNVVHGAIGDKYWGMGGPNSPLGCPTTYEIANPNGKGVRQHFAGGTMYWSHGTGAHPVWGAIGGYWGQRGWEQGVYGLPTSDEQPKWANGGFVQYFECGVIHWERSTGDTWGQTCR
ncbi:LGFP repeat-containing protein [Nocardioides speluncae]|uniref:LGFP repeat-containing protein n=1 Tax=Nocardioides speluncae TaxID=2670337 RepID=UPI000D69F776|nr:hypothetical protein [Nocardioides speluncae]